MTYMGTGEAASLVVWNGLLFCCLFVWNDPVSFFEQTDRRNIPPASPQDHQRHILVRPTNQFWVLSLMLYSVVFILVVIVCLSVCLSISRLGMCNKRPIHLLIWELGYIQALSWPVYWANDNGNSMSIQRMLSWLIKWNQAERLGMSRNNNSIKHHCERVTEKGSNSGYSLCSPAFCIPIPIHTSIYISF